MRVVLINPTLAGALGVWQPLGLGYLAGALARAGHEVRVFDRLACGDAAAADGQMLDLCRQVQPDFIGLGATTPLIPDAYHCAHLLRPEVPDATIILGGPHATALPEQTLAECPALDLAAVGEGELTLEALAGGAPAETVPGLAYRSVEGIKLSGSCQRAQDLDELAPPRRDLLAPKFYFRTHDQVIRGVRLRGAHLITGRGCTHRCRFCACSLCAGPGVRFHSVERVVSEIEGLVADHGIEGIYIADDVFLAQAERTVALCEAITRGGLHRKLRWCCQLRVNDLRLEVLRLLRRAGCVQVEFGLESGSQRVLDSMAKRATVAENYAAVRLAHEAGLRVFANIIVGYPGETREDLALTRQMLVDTKPDALSLNRFVPLPGSPVYRQLHQEGRLPEGWEQYTVGNLHNYTAMSDDEVDGLVQALHTELAEPTYLRSFYLGDLRQRPLHYAWEAGKRLLRSPVATTRRIAQILQGRGTQR